MDSNRATPSDLQRLGWRIGLGLGLTAAGALVAALALGGTEVPESPYMTATEPALHAAPAAAPPR